MTISTPVDLFHDVYIRVKNKFCEKQKTWSINVPEAIVDHIDANWGPRIRSYWIKGAIQDLIKTTAPVILYLNRTEFIRCACSLKFNLERKKDVIETEEIFKVAYVPNVIRRLD